jgi:pimeloyl-ACP methyl ester carboxylesterase
VGGLVGLALVLLLTGAVYEAFASRNDAQAYPAPGRLVDIGGGHRLHIQCLGNGSPVVVFDSGLGGTSLDWTLVQAPIAKVTRACAYDRAGMGWSDPPESALRSPKQIATELHALLRAAGIAGPYVLVGHSLGGKNVRMYARLHPNEVAGMVLVDARSEYMDFHATDGDRREMADQLSWNNRLYRSAAFVGLPRLFGAHLLDRPVVPANTRGQISFLDTREKAIEEVTGEAHARAASDADLHEAPSLGDRPLAVLASGQNLAADAKWRIAQREEAQLSTDSHYVVARGSGHFIQLEKPGLVIGEVAAVVQKVRARSGHP